jgi:hypothetical protein
MTAFHAAVLRLSANTSVRIISLSAKPGSSRHRIKSKCHTWLYQRCAHVPVTQVQTSHYGHLVSSNRPGSYRRTAKDYDRSGDKIMLHDLNAGGSSKSDWMRDMMSLSHIWHYATTDGVPRRSLLVAVVVGTILNLINQGDVLFGTNPVNWLKIALTCLVPYCVSTYGATSYRLSIAQGKTGLP